MRHGSWRVPTVGLGLVVGCAGRNMFVHSRDLDGHIAGLLVGYWHGLIAPLSLLGSLVLDINVYEIHNTGFPYNAGFLLGLGSWPWLLKRLRQWRLQQPAAPDQPTAPRQRRHGDRGRSSSQGALDTESP